MRCHSGCILLKTFKRWVVRGDDNKKSAKFANMSPPHNQSPHPVPNFWICPKFWTFAQYVRNIVQLIWTNLRGRKLGVWGYFRQQTDCFRPKMTHNAFYHLNKVSIYILLILFFIVFGLLKLKYGSWVGKKMGFAGKINWGGMKNKHPCLDIQKNVEILGQNPEKLLFLRPEIIQYSGSKRSLVGTLVKIKLPDSPPPPPHKMM